MTLKKKINILEYAFGEGGGGHQKAYAVYAFINVDNCERPLILGYSISATSVRHSKANKHVLPQWVVEEYPLFRSDVDQACHAVALEINCGKFGSNWCDLCYKA